MIFETADKPHWITSQPQTDDVAIIQLIQQLLYYKKDKCSQVHNY